MISNVAECYVHENWKSLIKALYRADEEDIRIQVEKAIQIGSSSGSEFILGVYCMAYIQNLRFSNHST